MTLSALTICCNAGLLIEQNIRHNLISCDRVVVVEGATNKESKELGNGILVTGGSARSTDDTQQILIRLQKEFPQKLRVVFAGKKPWPNKTVMVNEALSQCLPGIVMQSDYDEFFMHQDHRTIVDLMEREGYSEMEFFARHFWASPDYHCKIDRAVWGNCITWRRIFLYSGTERFASHEPPCMRRKWDNTLPAEETKAIGLVMFHYSYCLDAQVLYKERFYSCPGALLPNIQAWRATGYQLEKPPPGPMTRYDGPHPINVDFLRTPPGPKQPHKPKANP